MVTRYDYVGGSYPMGETVNGEYVDYDDYVELEKKMADAVLEIESLTKERDLYLDILRNPKMMNTYGDKIE